MKSLINLVVYFLSIFIFCSEYGQTIIVNLAGQGRIRGVFDTTSWSNQTFMRFMGIPFAESPKDQQRYKAPLPKLPWHHILNTTEYGRRCPVITSKLDSSQDLEDCLNLSVFTKNLTQNLPVMFYIYGGGFYNGSASDHPPNYLLEKDIVLVVTQYRVGPLGWLSDLSENMPGNAPVKDILLALEWVQDHIRSFGGDPEKVTIVGQSAGAVMAGVLLISERTPRNLFHRAIMQSGSILAGWGTRTEPQEQAMRICKALNCEHCHAQEKLSRCLIQAPVTKLLLVTQGEQFAPVIGDLYRILSQHPIELVKNYSRSIPIMMGFTKDDGSFVLAGFYDEILKKVGGDMDSITVRQFAEGIMNLEKEDTSGLSNNLLKRLLFSPDLLESVNHKKAIPAYFDLSSIQNIKSPMITLASKIIRRNTKDLYFYTFDYDGENTRFGYEFGNEHYPFNGGVHHSNDNIYLFATHKLNNEDTKMSKEMVNIWSSFIISGEPKTNTGEPLLLPMNDESGPYFHINENITIAYDILKELTATSDDQKNSKLFRSKILF